MLIKIIIMLIRNGHPRKDENAIIGIPADMQIIMYREAKTSKRASAILFLGPFYSRKYLQKIRPQLDWFPIAVGENV